jgi:hypothetical protein
MITFAPSVAPLTYQTTRFASTLRDDAETIAASIAGSFTDIVASDQTLTRTYSALFSRAIDTTGGQTIINEFSPWNDFRGGDDGDITWFWGLYPGSYQKTQLIDFLGTSETVVSIAASDDGEFVTAIAPSTVFSTYPASATTSSTLLTSWQTTTATRNAVTSTGLPDTSSVWTYSDDDWQTVEQPTTSLGTVFTSGQIETTTESGFEVFPEAARSTIVTISEPAYNTLILVSGGAQYALSATTTTVAPPELSLTSTIYGSVPFVQSPTLSIASSLGLNSLVSAYYSNYEGGSAGYATTLTTTTEAGALSWNATAVANNGFAGISYENNPPQATEGQIITSQSPGTPRSQETTTTTAVTAITHGSTTTTLASYETIALGPGQTTRSLILGTNGDITIETYVGVDWVGLVEGLRGFSLTSENVVSWPFNSSLSLSMSLSEIYPAITIGQPQGFVSSSASLQTSRINTLKFAVVGEGGSGTRYQGAETFNTISDKAMLFAPKSAQEFLPITGSASSSGFSMRYSGKTQSRTSTTGDTTSSTTSAWTPQGEAQTFWVDVSRNRVSGAPPFPTNIPALIVGGTGQALLPRGLYETYSGSGQGTVSGSNNFVSVNSVSSFSATTGVTAFKPIPYYVSTEGPGAQSTSASFGVNLFAQPVDD